MAGVVDAAAGAAKRVTRAGTHFVIESPLRAPTLAALRAGVRAWPDLRLLTAPAFYAGEALARRRSRLVGRLQTGSRIHLLASDAIHRHIYFYGEYESSTTRFLCSVASSGWTFVDVGANAGYYTLLAADFGGPDSSVHAFEPNPTLAELLEASAAGRPGIQVVRAACGRQDGQAELFLSPDAANSGLASLLPEVGGAATGTLRVDVLTLDGYCERHRVAPRVVKIDVEGFEPEVLEGAAKLLGRQVPDYLICEVVPDRRDPRPLMGRMAGCGYVPRSLGPEGELEPYTPRPHQNVVFLRG